MKALIQAAVDYVRELGGRTLEAYPTVPRTGKLPPVSSFMGIPAAFERAGFVQGARPAQAPGGGVSWIAASRPGQAAVLVVRRGGGVRGHPGGGDTVLPAAVRADPIRH